LGKVLIHTCISFNYNFIDTPPWSENQTILVRIQLANLHDAFFDKKIQCKLRLLIIENIQVKDQSRGERILLSFPQKTNTEII